MKVSQCHLCNSSNLDLVLSLTPTPPANEFVSNPNIEQECFPLDLFQCNDCSHFQLLDIVDAERLFKNYVYVSGTSPVFVRHFRNYAADLISCLDPEPNSLVVDIGSNDGTLLQQFKNNGLYVLGVDPARKIAADANAKGIQTVCAFFDQRIAKEIAKVHGKAKIITCNNCFAHVSNLNEIVLGMKELLADDGKIIIEVQYFGDMLNDTLFDMIYHEHCHYWTIKSFNNFMRKHELQVFHVEHIGTHGGSVRFYVEKINTDLKSTTDHIEEKHISEFRINIEKCKQELTYKLHNLKRQNKKIVAFGAPAKATTLMYHFNLDKSVIDYVIDDNPMKQGLYTPGLHIPVVSSQKLYEEQPEYCVIFAWNFAESIIKKCKQNGYKGKFIVPLPKVEVV